MKKHIKNVLIGLAGVLCPIFTWAQDSGLSGEIGGLQATLQQVYNTMIVHCSELIGVSRAIAGLATLWFVATRV